MALSAAITALGSYLPEYRLTYAVLEEMVDTNDEWITGGTGIKERRNLKGKGVGVSFMGIRAAQKVLHQRGISAVDLDAIVFATTAPDMPVAGSAAKVKSDIGASRAFAYDLQAASSGLLYRLATAAQYIESGRMQKLLLIGGKLLFSIIDYSDRTTCVIFGDGCGAVLLEAEEDSLGFQNAILRSGGKGRKHLHIKAGGGMYPASTESLALDHHYVHQEGQ